LSQSAVRVIERVLRLGGILALGWVSWGWLDARLYQAQQERELAEALGRERLAHVVAARDAEGEDLAAPSWNGARVEIVGKGPARVVPAEETPVDADTGSTDEPGSRGRSQSEEPVPAAERLAEVRNAAGTERAQASSARAERLTRLRVPRLGISVMVAPDVDARSLRRAVGHIPGTARPGEAGNVGIAGHRDTFFRPLKRVEVGDDVLLTTPDGEHRYVVEWTQIVDPDSVDVLAPTDEAVLTLVTCYPFYYVGHAPERFIVRARRVGGPDSSAAPPAT
jgi:sortase A